MKQINILLIPILLLGIFSSGLLAETKTLLDGFSPQSYSNNDGTQNFTGDWIEQDNDGGGVSGGNIYVGDGSGNANQHEELYFDRVNRNDYIARSFDASYATSMTISFNVYPTSLDTSFFGNDRDQLSFYLWNSSTGSYDSIVTMGASFGNTVYSYTTTDPNYMGSTAKVRFASGSGSWTTYSTSIASVDNFKIEITYPTDTDGDGVPDDVDVDDDNDGILDSAECPVIFSNGFDQITGLSDGNNIGADVSPWSHTDTTNVVKVTGSGYSPNGPDLDARGVPGNYYDVAGSDGYIYKTFTLASPMSLRFGGYFSAREQEGSGGVVYIAQGSSYNGTRVATTSSVSTSDNANWTYVDQTSAVLPAGTYTLVAYMSDPLNFDEGFVSGCPDSDKDGIPDKFDLDSDNDGIPDNVEAQTTGGFDKANIAWVDTDGDGLADQYDPDNGGTAVPMPDIDGDGTPDLLDSDSDNDGYTDCEEGNDDATGCPIDANDTNLGSNGMISWAQGSSGDVYKDTSGYPTANGNVAEPDPDSNGQLDDEVAGNNQAAYREFLCGKNRTTLTHFQWKIISFCCDTNAGTTPLSINDLLGGTSGLGTYGTDWVVFKQSGTDSYEVNATRKNTTKEQLNADSTVVPGKGYWIIADLGVTGNEKNITIPKTLTGLSPTSTVDTSSVSISNPNFTKVHEYLLPKNEVSNTNTVDVKKYMAGNPFPFAFQLSDLYFKHNASGASYNEMGNTNNNSYINKIVYKHDSNKTGPVDGYTAIDPATPGFNGSIQPMEGFFIKIEKNQGDSYVNHFAYPLMNK